MIVRNLFFLFVCCCSKFSEAQMISGQEYHQLKKEGKLQGNVQIINEKEGGSESKMKVSPGRSLPQGITNCNCWQPRDNTFSVVPFSGFDIFPPEYRNDDGSTNSISVPFTFCFYGTNYNSIYINTNGNISFGSPYSTFTATPFPDAGYSMIAPFWGDVDTRDFGSGLVYYKMTPTYLIVQWDSVGYYNTYSDKINTFQLIISNGTDPMIPDGNNVSFCYKDMQWTTGDASGGSNGFGGEPATVGANKGDGINYIQFGRFDQPGAAFDGPFGNADGVSWLDNQSFVFSTCNANNIPPIVTGFSICQTDTVKICEFDTLNLSVTFQSPESNQITTATATAPGVNGFSVISSTSGSSAIINTQFIGAQNNVGDNVITFSGTDDGTPVQTTVFDVIIHVDPAPLADAGPDTLVCNTGVALNATGGITFLWSPALGLTNPNIANPIAFPNNQTEYVVTVSNGVCSDKDTVIVSVAVDPDAGSDSSMCPGDSIQLIASGGTDYSWSPSAGLSDPGIFNPTASPISTTSYVVLVTDSNGCSNSDTVMVSISAVPVANAGPDDSLCSGSSINLNATGGTIYSWLPITGLSNPGISNPVATPTVTTEYIVSVSNGVCSDEDTLVVIVIPVPVAYAGPDTVVCDTGIALNATGGSSYSWLPVTGLSDPGISNPVAFPQVLTQYIVTVSNGICSAKDTVIVAVAVYADAGQGSSVCPGDTTQLYATGGVSYSWSPVTWLSDPDISDPFAFPLSNITYTVSVTDSNGCKNTDTVTISVLPTPIANAGNNVSYCNGSNTTLNASGGTTYQWQPTSYLSNPGIANPVASPATTTTYAVIVSNGICSDTDSVLITVHLLPAAFAGYDLGVCIGQDTILSASGGINYSWNPASGLSNPNISNPAVSIIFTTTYIVTVTDSNSCQNKDTVVVSVFDLPVVDAGLNSIICSGGSTQLAATGGISYFWTPAISLSTQNISNPVASPNATITYFVDVADTNNCINSDSLIVSVIPSPLANFTVLPSPGLVDTVVEFTNFSTTVSDSIISWVWDFGDNSSSIIENPSHVYTLPGEYKVCLTVTSQNFCNDSICDIFRVVPPPVSVPNIFTPNNDGRNDRLVFNYLEFYPNSHLVIFNRWGRKVFENQDYQNDWNGEKHPDGVYFYILYLPDETKNGTITLVR